jgi:hypothetical protein
VPHFEIVLVAIGWPFDPNSGAATVANCGNNPNPNPIGMVNLALGLSTQLHASGVASTLGLMSGLEISDDFGNCLGPVSGTCEFAGEATIQQPPICGTAGTTQDQIARLQQLFVCD